LSAGWDVNRLTPLLCHSYQEYIYTYATTPFSIVVVVEFPRSPQVFENRSWAPSEGQASMKGYWCGVVLTIATTPGHWEPVAIDGAFFSTSRENEIQNEIFLELRVTFRATPWLYLISDFLAWERWPFGVDAHFKVPLQPFSLRY